MKKLTLTLFLIAYATCTHAEQSTADEIIELLDIPLLPPITNRSLSADQLTELNQKRNDLMQKAYRIMAKNLEESMSAEDLNATLVFLKSPAGKSFFAAINNNEKFLDGMNEVLSEYQQSFQ